MRDNQTKTTAIKERLGKVPVTSMEALKAITLVCLFLSGWEEESKKNPGQKNYRAWKGYLLEIINELQGEELVIQFSKSVIITPEGVSLARTLKEQIYKLLNVKVDG